MKTEVRVPHVIHVYLKYIFFVYFCFVLFTVVPHKVLGCLCSMLLWSFEILMDLRIDNGGLALTSLKVYVFADSFMTIWSILKHNTSNESSNFKLLRSINDILLHTVINEIS